MLNRAEHIFARSLRKIQSFITYWVLSITPSNAFIIIYRIKSKLANKSNFIWRNIINILWNNRNHPPSSAWCPTVHQYWASCIVDLFCPYHVLDQYISLYTTTKPFTALQLSLVQHHVHHQGTVIEIIIFDQAYSLTGLYT